ncbi:sperm microtubule associated protein 1-like [Ruditapes philippinarum]|uniref:sperm microtubule associated protein 1-like n=1 Tax=Ruditapes philippinarum TaxID=129788 RepID=UPI00295AF0F7|nr:sperm microtubule associated protein 1-like [Ruditapes philippinarum]
MTDDRSKSAKRHNKLYRTPPTPPPEKLMMEERGFVLDCNAVSSISSDFAKANPKLGPVIPPYNSQKDEHVSNYFKFQGVDKTLEKTGQAPPGTSINGHVMDYFEERGPGSQYVSLRNEAGAGYSSELRDGHAQFMQGIKPAIGYNGQFGFRRNTPWLRQSPSKFGTASRSPAHEITVVPRTSGKTVQAK